MIDNSTKNGSQMVDPFGRTITYLRLSVTDRCDFRCVYCMSENMTFLPKKDLLSLEELIRLSSVFVSKGVRKIRISGGEPLVRKGIMTFFEGMAPLCHEGDLKELTLTTNGSLLSEYSQGLYDCGVRRINVSLDTIDPDTFHAITRWGKYDRVMAGIDSALKVGLKLKINCVALKGVNDHQINDLIQWCGDKGMDLTLIESMPMGDIGELRPEQYMPLSVVREQLDKQWTLRHSDYLTGGPSRYVEVAETGQRLGFITPLTNNFCAGCNRVRVTCTGKLYMCLGQDDETDLRTPLRASEGNQLLSYAIDEAITRKPKSHDFEITKDGAPAVARHMNVTGG